MSTSWLLQLENVFGWIYFVAWSATFYPQTILVWKRRTSAGLSADYMLINTVGFICYSIYTFASYSVPAVTTSYRQHTGYAPQVDTTDVYFAAHGAVMCSILVSFLFYFPPRTLPKTVNLFVCVSVQTLVVIGVFLCHYNKLDWYIYLNFSGLVKVGASLVKHFPQALLNRSRRSTVGWSFTMVLLDVVGGLFSVAQQTIRCIRLHTFAPFTSNLAKTFLAAESLAFDFYFITQHLFWYPDRHDIDLQGSKHQAPSEETSLLGV